MRTNQQIREAIHEALKRTHKDFQIQLIAVLDHGNGKLVAYHRCNRLEEGLFIRAYDMSCYAIIDDDGKAHISNDAICD